MSERFGELCLLRIVEVQLENSLYSLFAQHGRHAHEVPPCFVLLVTVRAAGDNLPGIRKNRLGHLYRAGGGRVIGTVAEQIDEEVRTIVDTAYSRVRMLLNTNLSKLHATIDARAENGLADIVRELRRSNKELQDFAYVTAHDLKAPLRGIGTLTDWITSDYADRLDEEGRHHLGLLKGRVARMSELIDSILHYSEIGRTTRRIESVDLNALLSEVIGQLSPPEHIQINVDADLPTLISEKARLIQLFQNLIGNAIKYMNKPQGRVEVGCIDQDDYWRFHVTDNGPGIDQKYFTKIFQMFQTLTRRDELESTGIGLAVVKKIVDLYGGNVWIESTVGEGTTFYFTLPKQPVVEEAVLASSETNLN